MPLHSSSSFVSFLADFAETFPFYAFFAALNFVVLLMQTSWTLR